jgi:ferredoxin
VGNETFVVARLVQNQYDGDEKRGMMQDWALPKIDKQICSRCGQCVDACPGHVLEMDDSGVIFAKPEDCTYCTTCEQICPEQAVTCTFEIGWA